MAAVGRRAAASVTGLGASVRNIAGEGVMSAFGPPVVTGVLAPDVPAESAMAKAGLQKDEVIHSVNGGKTLDTAALLRQGPELPAGSSLKIGVSRNQKEFVVQSVP
jgi:S1-C subfamily serine protease